MRVGNISPVELCRDDQWLKEQLARENNPSHRVTVPIKMLRMSPVLKPVISAIDAKRRTAIAREKSHCLNGQPLGNSMGFDGLIFKYLPLSFRVTVSTADRALLLMDTLIKACEKRGLHVSVGKDGLHVGEGEFSARLRISERVEKKTRSLADVPQNRVWMYRPFSYAPTGELTIYIERLGLERKVGDKPGVSLEFQLNTAICAICRAIAELRAWHDHRSAEMKALADARAAREAILKAEAARAAELEAAKQERLRVRAELIQEAAAWRDAELIRDYVQVVVASAAAPPAELTAWIAKARQTADDIDPMPRRLQGI